MLLVKAKPMASLTMSKLLCDEHSIELGSMLDTPFGTRRQLEQYV